MHRNFFWLASIFVVPCSVWSVAVGAPAAGPPVLHATRVIPCHAAADGRPAVVTGVAITPDGRTIAAATDDHCVLIWDVAAAAWKARLEGHADWVHSVGLAPDGKSLVSGAGDRAICLWDIDEQSRIFKTLACDKAVAGVAFHPNNQQVAVVGFSNRLQIINTSAGQTSQQLNCPCADVRTVTFSLDGTRLAVAGRNGRIRLWNVDNGSRERDIETDGRRIRALAFSPDGRLLAAAGNSPVIHVVDLSTGQAWTTLDPRPAKVWALLFVDNRQLAVGGTDNRISIWDLDSRQVTRRLVGHTGTVASLACDATGTVLVSGGYDTTLRIWDLADMEVPSTASREPAGASR